MHGCIISRVVRKLNSELSAVNREVDLSQEACTTYSMDFDFVLTLLLMQEARGLPSAEHELAQG